MYELTHRPVYSSFAALYPSLFADLDEHSLSFVSGRAPAGGLVLDAGCGVGQYAEALMNLGFEVVAVDREPELLRARSAEARARYVLATLEALPFASKFDLILARGVLNDLVELEKLQEALRSFAACLKPGGLLIADVRETEPHRGRIAATPVVIRQEGGLTFRSERTIDAAGLIHSRETFLSAGSIEAAFDFSMRTFTREETRELLAAAGLRVLSLLSGYGEESRMTDRIVIVAEAMAQPAGD